MKKMWSRLSRERRTSLIAYSFILPNFLGFAVFTLGPILFAFLLAFMEWDGNHPMEFIAIENFVKIIGNRRFTR